MSHQYTQSPAQGAQFSGQQPQVGQQGQQIGGQQPVGQQGAQQGGQQGGQQGAQQAAGMRLSDVETPQERQALQDVTEAVKVCAWCADQCIQEADPDMIECIRLCQDVTELGTTALELVPRQSRQAVTVLRALEQAMQACAQECGRHHHAHCQECAEVLGQATQSIQQLEQSFLQ